MCGGLKPEPGPEPRPVGLTAGATSIPARTAVLLVRAYQQVLAPWLGGSCRYWPTCSEYAIEAIVRFGALRGCWLAARRVGRCHPWADAGPDPVPARYVAWGRSREP